MLCLTCFVSVPLYACESFFDLFFHHYPGGSVFREAYESIVILSLYRLLVSLLGGPDQVLTNVHLYIAVLSLLWCVM
jgi:hypothetical protein